MRHMTRTALAALLAAAVIAPAQAQWVQVPIRNATQKANGFYGGEGGQAITNICTDSTGNVLLFATDVGGVYRSTNGGDRWEPINVGYKPRGSSCVAIDPANNSRFFSVGANSGRFGWHGLWRSTDQGATWSNILPKDNDVEYNGRQQIVFDPTSVSGGVTQTIYWSTSGNIASGDQGLWKSTDGGDHWTHLTTSYAWAHLAIHPTNGTLYVGVPGDGLYRSTTGGSSFQKVLSGDITGLAVSKAQPNWVYVLRNNGLGVNDIELSTDSGDHWAQKAGNSLRTDHYNNSVYETIRVSPVNPSYLCISYSNGGDNARWYSHDGGDTWAVQSVGKANEFLNLTFGAGNITPVFSPVDANTVYANAHSGPVKSADGGATFSYDGNGYTAFTCASIYNFNPFNPNLLVVTSQDFESAVTADGGDTWQYLDPHQTNNYQDNTPGWGGYNYGGYAFDVNTIIIGDAPYWGGDCTVRRTTDGGTTYNDWVNVPNADDNNNPAVTSFQKVVTPDPTDANRAFYGNLKTYDKGATWHFDVYISGQYWCDGVFTYNADPNGDHALYGVAANQVIKSTDHGASWQFVHKFANSGLRDVAYDWKNNRVYIADDQRQLRVWDGTNEYDITGGLPADNNGSYGRVATVCVDPVDPNILYIGNHADLYATNLAVAKGVYNPSNGTYTWTNLTKQPGGSGLDGARETQCVRVNPSTRDLWAFGECYGVWKYPFQGGGSSAPIGQTISLKANSTGKYVTSYQSDIGRLRADNATSVQGWEQFQIVDAGGGLVALKANATGYYVSCDLGDGDRLKAQWATGIGDWEKFQWVDAGNGFTALKANASGYYVTCYQNASGELRADQATTVGDWEKFVGPSPSNLTAQ